MLFSNLLRNEFNICKNSLRTGWSVFFIAFVWYKCKTVNVFYRFKMKKKKRKSYICLTKCKNVAP